MTEQTGEVETIHVVGNRGTTNRLNQGGTTFFPRCLDTKMAFIDPRTDPQPTAAVSREPTSSADDLIGLIELCKAGHVYGVETWIKEGRPLQLSKEASAKLGRKRSALQIALESENLALVFLLLCNGYDPNLEADSPLNIALQCRRWDLLDLLLEWGADPHRVCLDNLFDTYQSDLFERFRELGVDLTADHDLASALAYHKSNKPLFGFAKRYRDQDPKYQTELNIALVHHTGRGNAKGVQLCLWAGADPHADAPSLRYSGIVDEDDSENDEDRFIGWSAIYEACSHGHFDILKRLGPDPERDDFDDLYGATDSGAVIEFLARSASPKDISGIIQRHLRSASFTFGGYWSIHPLRSLFDVGARWRSASKEQIAYVRQTMVKLSNRDFVYVVKLLAEKDHCAHEILIELGRTPKFRARMKEVGFIPSDDNNSRRNTEPRSVIQARLVQARHAARRGMGYLRPWFGESVPPAQGSRTAEGILGSTRGWAAATEAEVATAHGIHSG